ncbi:MAG: IS5 family transposase [Verrucomicrobiota bacterium]
MSKRKRQKKSIGGLFTHLDRRSRSADVTTPLDKLSEVIDFESFRSTLEEVIERKDSGKGGRPPFDAVFMFKILVLQFYYGLSDEKTEFEILDRTSFQRFLSIEAEGEIPDRTTIWKFKEQLGDSGAEKLFNCFHTQLTAAGVIGKKGRIVDASFADAPRQRNTREENQRIKDGEGAPEEWPEPKKRQKDVDARWTKKNNETHFGFKNHVSVDEKSKLIDSHSTTPANVHDSQVFTELIDQEVDRVHADSAYKSEEHDKWLASQGIINRVHEKGTRAKPLNGNQQASNRAKSRIRVRVEHVFGFIGGVMRGDRIRTIGIIRARRSNTLINLTYNLARATQLGAAI